MDAIVILFSALKTGAIKEKRDADTAAIRFPDHRGARAQLFPHFPQFTVKAGSERVGGEVVPAADTLRLISIPDVTHGCVMPERLICRGSCNK